MTVIHDAWLFDPEGFAEQALGHAQSIASDPAAGYRALWSAAIAALDRASGWKLAEDYGGWDRASVVSEMRDDAAIDSEHLAFCFTLLLYARLAEENVSPVGLHTLWPAARDVLSRVGWNAADTNLLIKGHTFDLLVDRYLSTRSLPSKEVCDLRRIWTGIRPASVAGRAGWLDRQHVLDLSNRLSEAAGGVSRLKTVSTDESHALKTGASMLQAAGTAGSGLCLILSG